MAANKSHTKWSKEDNDWLLSNHKSMSIRILSEYFGRTTHSIRKQLTLLNCIRSTNKMLFSQKDIDYLINNYKNESIKTMANNLNRSTKSIYQKLKSININYIKQTHKKWTKEEEQKLLDLYNENKTLKEIKEKTGRTLHALRIRLKRKFGVCQKGKNLDSSFKSNNFYRSLRLSINSLTSGAECCLCGYNLFIDLHHIDSNRKNNNINNIASLCPNHHRELESGMYKNKQLYCMWWRINYDGSISEKFNNKNLILKNLKEIAESV